MRVIPCVVVQVDNDGVPGTCIVPSEPIPTDSVCNVFDGINCQYIVYEEGDEIPGENQ